jgi:small redox-active disulfide protein 2
MMKIEILGSGCPNCTKLFEMTQRLASELGIQCEIEKVKEMDRILSYTILSTPAIVINGEVKVAGRIPTEEEVKEHLRSV